MHCNKAFKDVLWPLKIYNGLKFIHANLLSACWSYNLMFHIVFWEYILKCIIASPKGRYFKKQNVEKSGLQIVGGSWVNLPIGFFRRISSRVILFIGWLDTWMVFFSQFAPLETHNKF
jgi:hypothetical protein